MSSCCLRTGMLPIRSSWQQDGRRYHECDAVARERNGASQGYLIGGPHAYYLRRRKRDFVKTVCIIQWLLLLYMTNNLTKNLKWRHWLFYQILDGKNEYFRNGWTRNKFDSKLSASFRWGGWQGAVLLVGMCWVWASALLARRYSNFWIRENK